MNDYHYYFEKAKLCECAEFVFRGGDSDLARFYRNAKIGFMKKVQRCLKGVF